MFGLAASLTELRLTKITVWSFNKIIVSPWFCQTYQHFKHTRSNLQKTRVSKHTIVTDKDTQPITNLKFSRHSNNKISKHHRNIAAFCTPSLNNSYLPHKNNQALRKLNVAAPYHSNHCQYRVKKMFWFFQTQSFS